MGVAPPTIKINEYFKSEAIVDMLLQRCPRDLSCVITNIRRSPRIPGNIAVIVQLLRNISTAELLTNVDKTKMQVNLKYLEEHFWGVYGKGMPVS